MVAELRFLRQARLEKKIGGEIKLFPPPTYHGELDDWSWRLKRYVGLCKPLAKTMMDEIETNAQKVVTDSLCEAYDVQQTGTQNNQLSMFAKAKQLAYMLAEITDGAARAIVRNEDTENGFEIWRRLFNQFSLPSRARATNLLNEILAFRLRQDHLESDLSDFIILKNRHEKTTGVPLDNDLLITLIMQKTTGSLRQHLRLNVRNINTFIEALEIVYSYIKSRHLVVPSRNDGPVDMDIGALKGRKGYGKGKRKGKGGMYKGKGRGFKGKGMFKGKGKSKGFKGKKGKGMKGQGKGQGCLVCGDPNHWSKECPKGKGRMSALTEEEGQQEGNQEKWSQDAEWYGDEWDECDWSQDWIGSLDDWSGDWSWSEDDWSYWSDDWPWGSQDWWSAEQPSAGASSGSQSTANFPQDPTKSVAAVTVETQDQNAARPSR